MQLLLLLVLAFMSHTFVGVLLLSLRCFATCILLYYLQTYIEISRSDPLLPMVAQTERNLSCIARRHSTYICTQSAHSVREYGRFVVVVEKKK